MSILHRFMLLIPFIFFLAGYITIAYWFAPSKMSTPSLVGKSVSETLAILAQHHLNARIIREQEDVTYAHETVLHQVPEAQQPIKEYQAVLLTISRHPPQPRAPSCIGMHHEQAYDLLTQAYLKPEIYYVPSSYPTGSCIAQHPQPGNSAEQSITLYCSGTDIHQIVWPDFVGQLASDAINVLQLHGIQPHIVNPHHAPSTVHAYIIEQRPLPGTLITPTHLESLCVQFLVD